MARRFVRHSTRPQKRTSVWLDVNLGTSTLVGASVQILGSLNAAALALRPFTVVRTRIEAAFASDQAGASEIPFGALGFIVVNDKASALGATGVPGPITNSVDDFFVWQAMSQNMIFLSSIGYTDRSHRYEIDSKAMRKVDAGDDVAIMSEMTASVGATLVLQGRMLVKLH